MLWRGVEKVIPDIRQRTEVELVGWTGLIFMNNACTLLFMAESSEA